MEMKWNIGNEDITDIFDYKKELDEEGINNPCLPNYLLDIKLYQQSLILNDLELRFDEQFITDFRNRYNSIDEIITSNRADLYLLETYNTEPRDNERQLIDFFEALKVSLSQRGKLPPLLENQYPEMNSEAENEIIHKIRLELEEATQLPNTYVPSIKTDISKRKYTIKKYLKKLLRSFGEEINNTYLCIKDQNKIHGMNLSDLDQIQMIACPSVFERRKQEIIDVIKQETTEVFDSYPIIDDYSPNGTPEDSYWQKAGIIEDYFQKRATNRNGILDNKKYTKKYRKYFEKHRRCIAIMKFDDGRDNLLSLSGTELNSDKSYKGSFTGIARIITDELTQLLNETYEFCKQNVYVKRYMHRVDKSSCIPLLNVQKLDDDLQWFQNQGDYSCCERKFLAKLEMDFLNNSMQYPTNIWLFTRFEICDNCEKGIADYKQQHNANIVYCLPY